MVKSWQAINWFSKLFCGDRLGHQSWGQHPTILGRLWTWTVSVAKMKLSNQSTVPVYTISGSNTARPLPEWLARRRKRSLKNDPEYANRVELLQDFEFEEASQCIRVSEDGQWVMSTGKKFSLSHIFICRLLNAISRRNLQTANPYTLSPTLITFIRSAYSVA